MRMLCATCPTCQCRREKTTCLPYTDEEMMGMYTEEEQKMIMVKSYMEHHGKEGLSKMEEIRYFCQYMGYKTIGLAFSMEARHKAIEAHDYFSLYFHVESALLTTGGIDKDVLQLEKHAPDSPECMANPVVQAESLNAVHTDINICINLPFVYDALFIKHSEAPVVIL